MSTLTLESLMEVMNEVKANYSFPPLTVIPSEYAVADVFYRRPRSKKKRIINKWRKRPQNHRREPRAFLINEDKLILGPTFYARFCTELKDT